MGIVGEKGKARPGSNPGLSKCSKGTLPLRYPASSWRNLLELVIPPTNGPVVQRLARPPGIGRPLVRSRSGLIFSPPTGYCCVGLTARRD